MSYIRLTPLATTHRTACEFAGTYREHNIDIYVDKDGQWVAVVSKNGEVVSSTKYSPTIQLNSVIKTTCAGLS